MQDPLPGRPGGGWTRWLKKAKALPQWVWYTLALLGMGIFLSIFNFDTLQPAPAPGAAGDSSLNTIWLAMSVFFKLGLVLVMIWVAALLFRRWRLAAGGFGSDRQIKVVETVHLSPRRALHLVRAGGQVMLIGATDQSVTLISELESTAFPEKPAQPAQPGASFSAMLAMMAGKGQPRDGSQSTPTKAPEDE